MFDGNGGTPTQYSKAVIYGQTFGTLPTAYKPYNTFSGWYTAPEGGYVRSATSVVGFTEPLTLCARYKGISSKINYDSNGGNAITTTKTVYCGSPYGILSSPTRTGYSFDGWYTSPYGGELITAESIVEATVDHTLYAHWTIYKPIITFNANGGRVMDNGYKVPSMKVIRAYGEYYGTLPVPTRTGYTFDGWSTSSVGTTRITENTIITVTNSDTIYARWIGNSYSVDFDANGGMVIQNSINVTYGSEYGTLPIPDLTGYTFTGWYTSVTSGTRITATTIVDILGKKTLYAQWKEDTINVSFNGNGGTMVINDTTVSSTTRSLYYNGTYGDSSGTLPSPLRTGYLFDGWYTAIEGGNELSISTNVEITETQKVYARWRPKGIPVFFDENGGNPIGDKIEVNYNGTYGSLPTPERAHYNFIGWFRSETGSTQVYESTTVFSASEITLYARWEPEAVIVTLDANGGTSSTGTMYSNYEGSYGILPIPSRLNYRFIGWFTEKIGGYKVEDNSEIFISENHTLYAHWEEGSYGVSFVANGYTLSTKYVMNNLPYGELPGPTLTGYFFNGWFTQEQGGSLIDATDIVQLTNYQILYAQWIAKTPTIVFYANSGNLDQTTKTVNVGSAYGELPVPTLAHYTFDGWYSSLNGTTQITAATLCSQVDTLVLYAHWTPETYTVTFDANGGTVASSNKVVVYDSVYETLPTPTNEGFDFLGWYTAPTGGTAVNAVTNVTAESNHTLYAHWKGKPCIITFNPNGGTVSTTQLTVYQNEFFGELPVPSKTGSAFDGWYTAQDGGTLVSASDTVTTSGALTLYAHWSNKNITITFDANGGIVNTESITVPYGGTYGVLPIPTLEYWTFDGWYTDPQEGTQIFDTDLVDTDNSFTVYAHWILKGEVTETLDELYAEYLDGYLTDRILPELIERGWEINSIDDISLMDDYDGDGLSLDQEYRNNTDPFNADTDMDGLSDYEELIVYGTNPIMYDTDEDGIRDKSEVSFGLNPLVIDTDEDGIIDSAETITQSVDLEIIEPFDINNTLVKPSIEITGAGDYYGKLYAQPITDYPVINALGCVVGNAFEFLHDESLIFERSTLTFTISDAILQNTPIEDLAIAYYDYDNNVLEILDTVYPVTGGAITAIAVSGGAITAEAISGSAITVGAVTGSAIYNTISAEVDHYSTYMVVNKRQYNNSTMNGNATQQSSGNFVLRLSNGIYIRVNKDPSLGDRSVDSDGDGLPDLEELGFKYFALPNASSSQPVETWTFRTNPASKDTDRDGYPDNQDYWDNTPVYINISKHSIKPYNMIMNGDNYFVDIHFNKYPYCTRFTKGEYVQQVERWLLNLELISKLDGKYDNRDIIAVAYLQKKHNVGSNGIIDNKTYWLLSALDDINKHKNDVRLGEKTQAELDAYNASAMGKLLQPQFQNPDYSQDYYMFYYSTFVEHMLIGTQSLATVLSMFPGGEMFDVAMFLYHVSEYKDGDQALIVSDLLALGVDVGGEFADEIIDVIKQAKRAAAKTITETVENILKIFKSTDIPEVIKYAKHIRKFDDYFEVVMHNGMIVKIMKSDLPASSITKIDNIADGALKGLGKIAGNSFDITSSGLSKVKSHLATFGNSPENAAMLQRLEDALASGRKLEGADACFYLHELKEADLMAGGMQYTTAHQAALNFYEVSNFSVYHPDVIETLSEIFNDNWFRFWGLK